MNYLLHFTINLWIGIAWEIGFQNFFLACRKMQLATKHVLKESMVLSAIKLGGVFVCNLHSFLSSSLFCSSYAEFLLFLGTILEFVSGGWILSTGQYWDFKLLALCKSSDCFVGEVSVEVEDRMPPERDPRALWDLWNSVNYICMQSQSQSSYGNPLSRVEAREGAPSGLYGSLAGAGASSSGFLWTIMETVTL